MAIRPPTVMLPEIDRWPPTPYAIAVATDATETKAIKKKVLSIAILMPISATLRALFRNNAASFLGFPYSFTSSAPETLNRSVIVLDISALSSNDCCVYCCNLRPTNLVGAKNTGSSNNESTVICQLKLIIVASNKTKVMALLITPEKVAVNALCAPITSVFILVINAPVWVRVKKAID